MKSVMRAVIDIGTNSVKLLVAEVADGDVRPVWEESRQTRLGQDFYSSHRLQAGPIKKTAEAVAEFAWRARNYGAEAVRVIATSAAREAVNGTELKDAIEQTSRLVVDVISGEQEADWVYQGVCTDQRVAAVPLLLLDVGGGSTEVIVGHAGKKDFRESYSLGSVRLLEEVQPADPPAAAQLADCRERLRQFIDQKVRPALAPVLKRLSASAPSARALVGTGGTASILGCMEAKLTTFDREKLEATRLSRDRLHWHVEHLWSLPLEQRKRIPGLPSNRADVTLTGAAIYEAMAQQFGFEELRISTRGLRFAAVLGEKSEIRNPKSETNSKSE